MNGRLQVYVINGITVYFNVAQMCHMFLSPLIGEFKFDHFLITGNAPD